MCYLWSVHSIRKYIFDLWAAFAKKRAYSLSQNDELVKTNKINNHQSFRNVYDKLVKAEIKKYQSENMIFVNFNKVLLLFTDTILKAARPYLKALNVNTVVNIQLKR